MNKLLVIFNTVGIGAETIPYYIDALNGIYKQKGINFDVTIASCLHDELTRKELQRLYPKVDIYAIDQKLPIHASFNHAILETLRHRSNDYTGYVYHEAGIVLEKEDDLATLASYLSDEVGLIVGVSPHDNGLNQYFGINKGNNDVSEIDKLFQGKDIYYFPPGFATNLHCAIYSRKLFDYYGKLQPDLLASHCMESLLTSLCGAINTKWAMTNKVILNHRKLNTIDSICFDPYSRRKDGHQPWEHGFMIESVMDRLLPGCELGLSYEACAGIMPPDLDKWDENGFALDNRLAPFLKKALFLSEEELPHNSIKSHFMMGTR